MIRSYYHCCCINEPVIFSHCVHLKLRHRFYALLKVCSDRDDCLLNFFPAVPVVKSKKSSKRLSSLFNRGSKKRPPPPPPAGSAPPPPAGSAPPLPARSAPSSAKSEKKLAYRKADANIVLLSLGTLEKEPTVMTGDPVHCRLVAYTSNI